MITLQALFTQLNQWLEWRGKPEYAPNGLQVEGRGSICKIAFSVSASLSVIEEAVTNGADALVVHHGIFWGKDPALAVGLHRKKLSALLQNEMSLLAYHLPLDAHPTLGNNFGVAIECGWNSLEPFAEAHGIPIGVIGETSPLPIEAFIQQMQRFYGQPPRSCLYGPPSIRKIGLVSGGAHRYFEEAIARGVDCFLTGTADEPVWEMAQEHQKHFLAFGHYATERIGILRLMKKVSEVFPVETVWIDRSNPF